MSVSQASPTDGRTDLEPAFGRLRAGATSLRDATAGLVADANSVAHGDAPFAEAALTTHASIAGPVMQIGRALLVAVIILIILGELYAVDIVQNPDNPNTFTNLTSTFASYGETAYIMVGLGLIALGASVALQYFGGFGGGGR